MPGCPFCDLPPSRRQHTTTLAYATPDAYAVTPGHTLVIPHRHVPTYFDATDQEKSALWSLVEIVKTNLDATLSPKPDGYNVGFNAGEAAGQTVPHLHVHVIPRYAGDVPNPRGGIRWVVPDKADYTAAPSTPTLATTELTTGPERPLSKLLLGDLARAGHVDIAVAFVFVGGVERVYPHLDECVERGGRVRIVTGDYGEASDPRALRQLLALSAGANDRVRLRIFETGRAGTSFHPKAYLVSSPTVTETAPAVAYVGSSNLSTQALDDGVEWNVRLTDDNAVAQARAAFDRLWTHDATRELDHAWIDAYEVRRAARPPRSREQLPDFDDEPALPAFDPHEIQREALDALQQTRAEGNRAGLVVLATGLGKTWLSAFDSVGFARVLFVAHREEILRQALSTYRRIRPDDRFGLYTGERKDLSANVLFASVQTLARDRHLRAFDPKYFDYIVVDEFHHADASTYRKLIRHFDPKFLLGLTATPERTDGGDLLALCDENLVYRCDLGRGIARDRLAPFQYFGVPDLVDYANIPWRSTRFDLEALTTAVETKARADNALQQWRTHGQGRTLGFCVSQRHADFMRAHFTDAGLRTASVHSGPTSDPRVDSLQRLQDGDLDVLFAVDMFNEGLDVRHIETVLMLRPTESKILWLQQIGRGLRKAEGKTHLRIIDYIGNHKVFLNKPLALLSAFGIDVPHLRQIPKLLSAPIEGLPKGCEVTYELEAIEILSKLVPSTRQADAFVEWYEAYRERMNDRPTALQAHGSGYNPRALRRTHGGWLAFVDHMGDLEGPRRIAWDQLRAFLDELETTPMTRSYKMLVVQAMLWLDAIPGRVGLDELTAAVQRIAGRSAMLRRDFSVDLDDAAAVKELLRKNPIAAWMGRTDPSGRPFFVLENDELATGPALKTDDRDAASDLVTEIVEWRLARYLDDRKAGVRFKVLRNASGKPIVKIDRKKFDLPEGWVDVEIDGEPYEANFVKEFVNVVRPKGEDGNVLPDVMYRWFGDDAGKRGTAFGVSHAAEQGGGYRWEPVRGGTPTEGVQLRAGDGTLVDARVVVEVDDDGTATVVLMSRGGGRNDEYNRGLELVLERLGKRGWVIERIAVESGRTAGTELNARTVTMDAGYPIDVAARGDVVALRKAIGRGIAAVGRAPGAKGRGNANKRIRVWVQGAAVDELRGVILNRR